ncbi:MAG: transketolase [Deltaproteobacteria bacterium]|nr:transketolase [Deltaproteobacteria bacterium]
MKHTKQHARNIRIKVLEMIHQARASHIGGCFSIADILAVLYTEILKFNPKKPEWPDRDRLILSKGHAAAALYATLSEFDFFSAKKLETFCKKNSALTGHCNYKVPGVEVSTGSLGHGLSLACGMALAAKAQRRKYRVFVILSDGEMDEGSTMEAALFAPHHKLDNLVTIIDYNKIQSFGLVKTVLNLEPLADKWRAFNWGVQSINGHNHAEIFSALSTLPLKKDRPSVVIANTIKGKGVSYMENSLAWHYRSPDDPLFQQALKELEQS